MPLQNRVAPDGSLHSAPDRGMFTGNRGVIHDPDKKTLTSRRWTTQSWIVCTLHWRERRRDVWGRNRPNGRPGWSELFFLDEVTALAAGHRPCFYCRRSAATAFMDAFNSANRFDGRSVILRDRLLHSQRWASRRTGAAVLTAYETTNLPDGVVVESKGRFFAKRNGDALGWTFAGYTDPCPLDRLSNVRLVTPPAICGALEQGYRPIWHKSATE